MLMELTSALFSCILYIPCIDTQASSICIECLVSFLSLDRTELLEREMCIKILKNASFIEFVKIFSRKVEK